MALRFAFANVRLKKGHAMNGYVYIYSSLADGTFDRCLLVAAMNDAEARLVALKLIEGNVTSETISATFRNKDGNKIIWEAGYNEHGVISFA